jgi:hypothetical protein
LHAGVSKRVQRPHPREKNSSTSRIMAIGAVPPFEDEGAER